MKPILIIKIKDGGLEMAGKVLEAVEKKGLYSDYHVIAMGSQSNSTVLVTENGIFSHDDPNSSPCIIHPEPERNKENYNGAYFMLGFIIAMIASYWI